MLRRTPVADGRTWTSSQVRRLLGRLADRAENGPVAPEYQDYPGAAPQPPG